MHSQAIHGAMFLLVSHACMIVIGRHYSYDHDKARKF